MTNGGGSTEADRVARLSAELGIPVSVILALVVEVNINCLSGASKPDGPVTYHTPLACVQVR